jgi:hypothetical protein
MIGGNVVSSEKDDLINPPVFEEHSELHRRSLQQTVHPEEDPIRCD